MVRTRWAAYSATAVGYGVTRPTSAPVGRAHVLADAVARSRHSMASSSLSPPRARNLMPLSGIGLWRRGEHHAEVGAELAR